MSGNNIDEIQVALKGRAQPFVDARVLDETDVNIIAFAARRFGESDIERLLGLCFALRAPRQGHAGVDLERLPEQLAAEPKRPVRGAGAAVEVEAAPLPFPASSRDWLLHTLTSTMVSRWATADDASLPFVAQEVEGGTLLLTRRMFVEQTRVADAILERLKTSLVDGAIPATLEDDLMGMLPEDSDKEARDAVRRAARNTLAIVTGGPGTGKTFSLTRLLAVLLRHEDPSRPLVIELAAPTGKAAVRMGAAINEGLVQMGAGLAGAERLNQRLRALSPRTVHKLIGLRPDGTCAHDKTRLIAADVIVIDEVSMVDLSLMRRLLEAVPPAARLILLGDRDQLASVEAGSVLADLVRDALRRGAGPEPRLWSVVHRFTMNHRFATAPDIALLASSLHGDAADGDVDLAVKVFQGETHAREEPFPGARVRSLGSAPEKGPSEAQLKTLTAPYLDSIGVLAPKSPAEDKGYASMLKGHLKANGDFDDELRQRPVQAALLAAFEGYRVLAVHRRGGLGVESLNEAVAKGVMAYLQEADASGRKARRLRFQAGFWLGAPVLVTVNAYDVGLRNGDVGLVLPDPSGPTGNELSVAFPSGDGSVKHVGLDRLPAHEGAFVMTVHKAQGSQFKHVALVLAARESPIQTRELIYTGVTRASNRLTWMGEPELLRLALNRRIARASGLAELLR